MLPDINLFLSKIDFWGQKRGCGGPDQNLSDHFQILYNVIKHKFMEYLTSACPYVNFDWISPPLLSSSDHGNEWVVRVKERAKERMHYVYGLKLSNWCILFMIEQASVLSLFLPLTTNLPVLSSRRPFSWAFRGRPGRRLGSCTVSKEKSFV